MGRHVITRLAVAGLAILGLGLVARAGEPEGPKPPAEAPRTPAAVFTLADGSRVSGEVGLKEIRVKTAYGELVLPIEDVFRLRVAQSSNKDAREKVAALIKQLGAADFNLREKAYDEIYKLGPAALGQLREAEKHPDAEVRNRVEKLLTDLESSREEVEEQDRPLEGDNDEIVSRHFTIRGVVQVEKFEIRTRYGSLEIPRGQVVAAAFNRPEAETKSAKVAGTNSATNMLATKVRLKAGDEVRIKATGNITFQNWGRAAGPDGDAGQFGTQFNDIPGMALVGRIGTAGDIFLLGSSKRFTAESAGDLYLGVAYQGNSGRSTGEYAVRVTITPKGK